MKSFLLFKLKTISHTFISTALITCLSLDHNNRTYLDCSNCQASMTKNLMTHHNIINSLHIFPCPNKFSVNFKTQFIYPMVPSRITLATLLIFLSLCSKDTITLTQQLASWSNIVPNWFKQYLLYASYVQDRMFSIAFFERKSCTLASIVLGFIVSPAWANTEWVSNRYFCICFLSPGPRTGAFSYYLSPLILVLSLGLCVWKLYCLSINHQHFKIPKVIQHFFLISSCIILIPLLNIISSWTIYLGFCLYLALGFLSPYLPLPSCSVSFVP